MSQSSASLRLKLSLTSPRQDRGGKFLVNSLIGTGLSNLKRPKQDAHSTL